MRNLFGDSDSPGTKFLLDRMVTSGVGSRLVRDIRVGDASWFTERKKLYLAHIGHNLFGFDAGYDVIQRVRYYPLLG